MEDFLTGDSLSWRLIDHEGMTRVCQRLSKRKLSQISFYGGRSISDMRNVRSRFYLK